MAAILGLWGTDPGAWARGHGARGGRTWTRVCKSEEGEGG